MHASSSGSQDAPSTDEMEVRTLYQALLESWNQRNAAAFVAPFAEDGEVIGFDGSQMSGRVEIASKDLRRPCHWPVCEQSPKRAAGEP